MVRGAERGGLTCSYRGCGQCLLAAAHGCGAGRTPHAHSPHGNLRPHTTHPYTPCPHYVAASHATPAGCGRRVCRGVWLAAAQGGMVHGCRVPRGEQVRRAWEVPSGCSPWLQGRACPRARSLRGTLQPHATPHLCTTPPACASPHPRAVPHSTGLQLVGAPPTVAALCATPHGCGLTPPHALCSTPRGHSPCHAAGECSLSPGCSLCYAPLHALHHNPGATPCTVATPCATHHGCTPSPHS